MKKQVEFYFDFGSPTSYLAYKRLTGLCAENNAELVYKPVLLGAIFKATGNNTPAAIPAKGRYMMKDMARFAGRHDIPMQFNPHFPLNTLGLMRGAVAAADLDVFQIYSDAVFDATWVNQKNMDEASVVQDTLEQAGLPVADLLARAQTEDVKNRLKTETEEAIARGIFGCPTLFVGEEMFFGQDRMDFLVEALASRTG